jgi:tetratricopeptide (TPR) repeat protein
MSACYRKLHDIDKAITFGIESLRTNSYFVLNLIQLGDLYAEKGNTKEAQKYYRLAYEINPHNKALKGLIKNAE